MALLLRIALEGATHSPHVYAFIWVEAVAQQYLGSLGSDFASDRLERVEAVGMALLDAPEMLLLSTSNVFL